MSNREPKDLLDVNQQSMTSDNLSYYDRYLNMAPPTDVMSYQAPFSISSDPRTGIPANRHSIGMPVGMDAEEYMSQQQSTANRVARGSAKFLGRIMSSVLGGTVGSVYGAGSALTNWEFNKFFDNDFARSLDTLDEKMREALPNYQSIEERYSQNPLKGFIPFTKGSANFWFDKVADGLGFSIGAILTEVIWGLTTAGIGNIARASAVPRAVRLAKAASMGDDVASLMSKVALGGTTKSLGSKVGDAATLLRRVKTGAGYEAGVEARMTMDEHRDWGEQMLREKYPDGNIPQWEKDRLESDIEKIGMTNYLHNLILVGGGNLLQFPKIFGGSARSIQRSFKEVYRNSAGQYVNALSQLSKGASIARNTAILLKNPLYEGFVEEGGQGWSSESIQDYFQAKYNRDFNNDVSSLLYSATRGFEETYGTAQGLQEVVIGFIVGGIGSPGLSSGGGALGALRASQERIAAINEVVEYLNAHPDAMNALKNHRANATNQMVFSADMDKAFDQKDLFTYHNSRADAMYSYIVSRIEAGFYDHIQDDIDAMANIPIEEFKKEIGVPVEQEFTEKDRDSMIRSFKERSDQIKKHYDKAKDLYPADNPTSLAIRDALTYSLATLSNVDSREKSIGSRLSELTGGRVSHADIRGLMIQPDAQIRLNEIKEELKKTDLTQEQKADLKAEQRILNQEIKDQKGKNIKYYVIESQRALLEWVLENDVDIKGDDFAEAKEARADLIRLAYRRQNFIEFYNSLFTEDGIAKLEENQQRWQQTLEQETAKLINEADKNIADVDTMEDAVKQTEEQQEAQLDTELGEKIEEGLTKESEPVKDNLPLPDKINNLADRMARGEQITSAEDKQLYQNNREEVEFKLREKRKAEVAKQKEERKIARRRKSGIIDRVKSFFDKTFRISDNTLESIQLDKARFDSYVETYTDYEMVTQTPGEAFLGAVSNIPGVYKDKLSSKFVTIYQKDGNLYVKDLDGKETKIGPIDAETTFKELGITPLKHTIINATNIGISKNTGNVLITVNGKDLVLDRHNLSDHIETDEAGNPTKIVLTNKRGSIVTFTNPLLVHELAFVIESIQEAIDNTINDLLLDKLQEFAVVQHNGVEYYVYGTPTGPVAVSKRTGKILGPKLGNAVINQYRSDISSIIDTVLANLNEQTIKDRKELKNEIQELDSPVRPPSAGESLAAPSQTEVFDAKENEGQAKEEARGPVEEQATEGETIDESDVTREDTQADERSDLESEKQMFDDDGNFIEQQTENIQKEIIEDIAEEIEDNINVDQQESQKDNDTPTETDEFGTMEIVDDDSASQVEEIEALSERSEHSSLRAIRRMLTATGLMDVSNTAAYNLNKSETLRKFMNDRSVDFSTLYAEAVIDVAILEYHPALKKFFKENPSILTKLQDKQKLSKEDVSKLMTIEDIESYTNILDVFPIKLILKKKGTNEVVLNDEISFRNSGSESIRVPHLALFYAESETQMRAISFNYINNERNKIRSRRQQILTAILNGNQARINSLSVTRGHVINAPQNRTIKEALGLKPSEMKFGVAKSSGVIYSTRGKLLPGYGAKGNMYLSVDKTINGQPATIKLNPVRVNQEQAKVVLSALAQTVGKGKGFMSAMTHSSVKADLQVREILSMLMNIGDHTKPTGEGDAYLSTKQVFIENKILNYGIDGKLNLANYTDTDAQAFYDWAVANKNLPISLHRLTDPKFKIWSDFNIAGIKGVKGQSYMDFLFDSNNYALTDITDPFFRDPNLMFDPASYEIADTQPAVTEVKETPKEEVKKEPLTGEAARKQSLEDLKDIGSDIFGDFNRVAIPGPYTKMDFNKELAWYKDAIGDEAFVQLRDDIITVAGKGIKAFGQFSKDGIVLWKDAMEGTLYHEAMHRVTLLLLSSKEWNQVKNMMIKEDLVDTTDTARDMHETLAEMFAVWKIKKQQGEKQPEVKRNFIQRVFDRIYNFIRLIYYSMFDANITSVERLFNLVDTGAYKWRSVSQWNLKNRLKDDIYYHDVSDLFTDEEVRDWVQNITYILLEQGGVDSMQDISKIRFSQAFEWLQKTKDTMLESYMKQEGDVAENTMRLIELYEDVIQNADRITPLVIDYLRSLNIRSEEIHPDEANKEIEFSDEESEFKKYNTSTHESSAKDNVLSEVKLLMSLLPDGQGRNPYNNLGKFMDFGTAWYTIMRNLHDAPNIDIMMERINTLAETDPAYKKLLNRLSKDENLKTQFEVSIKKMKNSYLNVFYNPKTNNISIINANIQSSQNKTLLEWGDIFLQSKVFIDGKPNKEHLKDITEKYNTLNSIANEYSQKGIFSDIEGIINATSSMLNMLSIGVTPEVIKQRIVDSDMGNASAALHKLITVDIAKMFAKDGLVDKLSKGQDFLNKNGNLIPANRYLTTESIIKELAYDYLKTTPEAIDPNTLGPDGSVYYEYTEYVSIANQIEQLKHGNLLELLSNGVYQRNSILLEQLRQDPNVLNKLGIENLSGFYQENRKDLGRGFHDIHNAEDMLIRIYAMLSNKIPMQTFADRKTMYFLTGINRVDLKLDRNPQGQIIIPADSKIWSVLEGYLSDEWASIQQARQAVDTAIETGNNTGLIKNIHYKVDKSTGDIQLKDKSGNYYGNGANFTLFSDFNKTGYNSDGNRAMLKKIVQTRISEELANMEKLGLIQMDPKRKYYKSLTLNKNFSKIYEGKRVNLLSDEFYGKNGQELATYDILFDYILNQMIFNAETIKVFLMDPAYYADQADFDKRITILGTGGTLYRTSFPVGHELHGQDTYTAATAKTNFVISDVRDDIESSLTDIYKKLGHTEAEAIKKAEERSEPFDNIDPTDGIMYIAPELYRSLAMRGGEWNNNKERAYRLLESDTELSMEEHQLLADIALQPLKTVYFGIESRADGLNIPVYDKMSMFTIFKRFAKNRDIMDVYERMTATGKYQGMTPLNAIKYDTAVKVGDSVGVPIYNEDGTLTDFSQTDFNPREQYFHFLYKQQVTTPKREFARLTGTQFIKIMMGNHSDNPQIVKEQNMLLSEISNRGEKAFRKKYGIVNNPETNRLEFKDLKPMLNDLREAAILGEMSDNVLNSLTLDDNGRPTIAFDAIPDRKWIYNRLISLINDSNVTLTLPGMSAVQVSSFGVKGRAKGDNHLKVLSEGNNYVEAEAIISIAMFRNIIPNYKNLTHAERVAYVQGNPSMVSYRIPTQGYNSILLLKITEFAEESMGDVIFLPLEVTKITGSDFDIDKQYVVSYNYEIKDDKMSRIPFLSEANSTVQDRYNAYVKSEGAIPMEQFESLTIIQQNTRKAIENKLIDNWINTLKQEKVFTQSITPLDLLNSKLKNLAKEISTLYEIKTPFRSLHSMTPSYTQMVKDKNKGSDRGIGPFALHNVHHTLGQVNGLRLRADLPIPSNKIQVDDFYYTNLAAELDIDGNYITDKYSAFITAFVDAVKDPYIADLNVNPTTFDIMNLLLRSGSGMWGLYFLNQPVIRDYVTAPDYNKFIKGFKNKKNAAITKYRKDNKLDEAGIRNAIYLAREKFTEFDFNKIEELKKNFGKHEGDMNYYLGQEEILKRYFLLNKFAKNLNKTVTLSQIDTKKYGYTLSDIHHFVDNMYDTIYKNNTPGFNEMINNTFLKERLINGPIFALSLGKSLTITATDHFNELVKYISKMGLVETESGRNFIANKTYSYILSKFLTDTAGMNVTPEKLTALLYGNDSVANRTKQIKNGHLFANDGIQNKSIVKLLYATIENDGVKPDSLITFNSQIRDTWTKNSLIRSWQDMLSHSNDQVRRYAEDLALYAIYTSGMTKGIFSFYQYIPVSYLKDVGMSDFFNKTLEDINNRVVSEDLSKMSIDVLSNLWYREDVVPTIQITDINRSFMSKEGGYPILTTVKSFKGGDQFDMLVGANAKGQPVYSPVIKLSMGEDFILYKYVGFDNKVFMPVYKAISKRGYYEKGMMIEELNMPVSALPSNNLIESIDDSKDHLIHKFQKKITATGEVTVSLEGLINVTDFVIAEDKLVRKDFMTKTDILLINDSSHAIESLVNGQKTAVLTNSISMGERYSLSRGDIIEIQDGTGKATKIGYRVTDVQKIDLNVLGSESAVEQLKKDHHLTEDEFTALTKNITFDNTTYSVHLEAVSDQVNKDQAQPVVQEVAEEFSAEDVFESDLNISKIQLIPTGAFGNLHYDSLIKLAKDDATTLEQFKSFLEHLKNC